MDGLFKQVTVRLGPKLGWPVYWSAIRRADQDGDWTIATLQRCTGLPDKALRNLLDRLVRGALAKRVKGLANAGRRYRLVEPTEVAPRLDASGEALPEPLQETIWRAAKMAKRFTAREIVALVRQDRLVTDTVRRYLAMLADAGVLAVTGQRGEEVYRVRRSLGARAPIPVRATGLFDPNTGTFIGALIAEEVAP